MRKRTVRARERRRREKGGKGNKNFKADVVERQW
jgi:hypothetical protein